jgi:hypothetical protein
MTPGFVRAVTPRKSSAASVLLEAQGNQPTRPRLQKILLSLSSKPRRKTRTQILTTVPEKTRRSRKKISHPKKIQEHRKETKTQSTNNSGVCQIRSLKSGTASVRVLACALFDKEEKHIYVCEGKGHKDEEAVLFVYCDTSNPVPRSTRRTGVFIDFRASEASSAYSASRRETGEASFVLSVEITKAMQAVRQHILFNNNSCIDSVINNVCQTAYHKTTVHSNETPCLKRCLSHITLYTTVILQQSANLHRRNVPRPCLAS